MWNEEHKFQIWILKNPVEIQHKQTKCLFIFFNQYCTWIPKDKDISCIQGDI